MAAVLSIEIGMGFCRDIKKKLLDFSSEIVVFRVHVFDLLIMKQRRGVLLVKFTFNK